MSKKNISPHNAQADVPTSNIVRFPAKLDVVASIRIEMRRGGRITKTVDGVSPTNAYRLAAFLLRVFAEIFTQVER